jgi:acetyl-CoA acetyltransferase
VRRRCCCESRKGASEQFNLKPLARFAGYAVAGVPPEIMGIGPIEAIPRVLRQAGIRQDEVDWFELNEAFAAQALAVIRTLEIDPAKVNPLGGAIALGHPLGATGAIRTATVVHGLQRDRPALRHGDHVYRHRHGRRRPVRGDPLSSPGARESPRRLTKRAGDRLFHDNVRRTRS